VSAPLHVSIHDVSPAFSDEVRLALRMCHSRGLKPALLVVPNFHAQAPLVQAPEFCAELRELQRDGHEVFLHGYYHRTTVGEREAMSAQGLAGRATTLVSQSVVSGNEAECSLLTHRELESRIANGEGILAEVGLAIDGFVPPAWGLQPSLEDMLARRGYRYLEERLAVVDPVARRRRRSLVLNFASRNAERIASTVAFCRVARPLAALTPTRIALHPKDLHVTLLRHETENLLDWARERRVGRAPDLFH
jgi:predicted deacetylase